MQRVAMVKDITRGGWHQCSLYIWNIMDHYKDMIGTCELLVFLAKKRINSFKIVITISKEYAVFKFSGKWDLKITQKTQNIWYTGSCFLQHPNTIGVNAKAKPNMCLSFRRGSLASICLVIWNNWESGLWRVFYCSRPPSKTRFFFIYKS